MFTIYSHVVEDHDCKFVYNLKFSVFQPLSQPQTKREYCIKEMVETEKNYVDALNMIIVVCRANFLIILFFIDVHFHY